MEIILVTIFVFVLSIVIHHRRKRVAVATQAVNGERAWIRDYLIDRNQYTRVHQERETVWWQSRISSASLDKIKRYIVVELSQLPRTDWESQVFDAICNRSSGLKHYLTNGRLDLDWLAKIEEEGIKDAVRAIKQSNVYRAKTLRQYFHLIFENIVVSCRSGNYFYLCGQLKVLRALKSYVVSVGKFEPSIKELFPARDDGGVDNDDNSAETIDIFGRLAGWYEMLEAWRKKYLFDIATGNKVVEFNLEKIRRTGNFQYQGSLVNCLFLELRDWLMKVSSIQYSNYSAITENIYDGLRVGFIYGTGMIYLVKLCGTVEYFPERLYIEFENLTINDPIIQKLRIYKIRLEGDD